MPISFPDLLRDSWNFIRNQRAFFLYGTGCLVLLQIITLFFVPQVPVNAGAAEGDLLKTLPPTLILATLNIFITILLILNIKAINNGEFGQFFQPLGKALAKLPTVIMLNIIMVLPFSIGISFQRFGGEPGAGLTIIALPLIISGIFLFIKLCLVVYAYLVEELKGVSESIGFIWNLSRGRTLQLAAFCLIAYLLPQFLTLMIANIGGANLFTVIVTVLLGAFLSLFVTVFGFRFYQLYRQSAPKG